MSLHTAFRDISIRSKLSILIVLCCSFALILAGGGFLSYEFVQYRLSATRSMSSLAGILAASSTAPLAFGDERAELETLSSLRGDPKQMQAAVYNGENRLFASYQNPSVITSPPPAHPRPPGAYFEGEEMLLFQPIVMGNQSLGTIFLKYSMAATYQRLWNAAGVVCLTLVGSLAVALLLGTKILLTITRPLAELSDVARHVSLDKDYSVRATKLGNDETGLLIDSFNEMLSQIQSRDQASKVAEIALRDSDERYALATQGSNDGLWDWKVPSHEIYFSPRWKQMLGYSDDEIKADPEEWFGRIHPGDRARATAEIAKRSSDAPADFSCEYRISQKSGIYIWVLCRGIVVQAKGKILRMAGSQTDITQGKILDPLTGLRNRLYFIDKLESYLEAEGEHDKFAVLFLDLDRFKVVNDSLGHDAGDRLLVEVAARLQASVRASDLVARNASSSVISRFGGDEFAILLNGVRQPRDAAVVAERIIKELQPPFYLEEHPIFVSVSIGVALGDSAHTPEDLLRNADAAMYHAKNRGKGRFEIFNQGIRDRADARLELETDLRKAVKEKQFVVYYQPEVSLLTGRTIGFEALARWQHPRRGLLPPSEFIHAAEETGLIIPLGRWMLQQACRQMAEWHRGSPSQPPLSVSVNMCLKQLADPRFVDDVSQALKETGLNPPSLRLELTESSIMEDKALTLSVLRRLKDLNVGIELDDFGTGYSSLSYLHELPFDAVKIDASFVNGMPGRPGSSQMIETILGMARSLHLDVVAEGVETAEQRDTLIALHCPFAQGFLFSKPVDQAATQKSILADAADHSALEEVPVG
ncbi:MAG: EAL domain-containing protein [Bryobacteraceae bacterium]